MFTLCKGDTVKNLIQLISRSEQGCLQGYKNVQTMTVGHFSRATEI